MFVPSISTLALVAASASVAFGQAVWDRNQVSTSICQWRQLRAAVIRDTVFLDGGELWWKAGLSSGEFISLSDNNPLGITWKLNLSKPFDTTGNFTEKLEPLYGNNGMPATNIAPNYFDGALLYNNDGWFYYGGLLQKTASLADPPGDRVRGYRAYSSKVDNLQPQFVDEVLDKGLTRYVSYGGAASAPSENKAWYFSGLRARNWGPVHMVGGPNVSQAVTVVNSMVTVDMTIQQREEWDFKNLTDGVPGRANPELVWVPVGSKGILVVLGGVVDPDFVNVTGRSSDDENNKTKSPEFMSTIDIYDIAGDKWYRQKTDGGPGALTRGCAVVAPAPDGSSFNIYYYGGYDGRRQKNVTAFSDDVWVLSLPSFTWVKLHQGTGQARAGHKCVMPYPDQMIVIGGYPALEGQDLRCLEETVRVFNLTTGKWVQRYDPAVWSKYAVPDAVVEKIGGSPTGGATKTTPSPSFAPSLSAVFATQYPTSKIMSFYPYASVAPINNTNPNLDPAPDNNTGGGGLPSYLPPVLGVVLGLVFLTVIAVFILLWRRRRYFKKHGSSVAGTEDTNGHRIMNWIRNQPHPPPADAKTPTVASTTEYIPGSTTDLESVVHPQSSIVEMMNTEVKRPAELMDTSPPAELHDMPMTHIEVLTRHSHLGESPAVGRGAVNNGSFYSNGTNQIDHASTISHPVSAFGATPPPPPPPPPPKDSPVTSYRPDSDALGNPLSVGSTPTSATGTGTHSTMRNAVLSGISNLSERDRSHLRQISDTTVSSITSGHAQLHQPLHADGRILSPTVVESPGLVTPPSSSALGTDGMDYLSARPLPGQNNNNNNLNASASSPLRRSVFTESRDDMSDPNAPGGGANRI